MLIKSIAAGALVAAGLLVIAVDVRAQELSELSLPPNGLNQGAEVSQWIGLVKVTIAYHSPNVHGPAGRDRTGHIWGELVKYGMFDDGFGPSKAAPYTEFLAYGFDDRRLQSAVAFLQWEKQRAAFSIAVPNSLQLYVDQMRKDLLGWPGFNYQNWQNAAQFCADNKINLEEALVWAEKAISEPFRNAAQGRRDFFTLKTKADVLRAMERGYGTALIAAGRQDKAMTIFRLNRQRHPDEAFVTFVGLARGYTALGDTKNAIANWEIALENVPENQKVNLPVYERALEALKEKR